MTPQVLYVYAIGRSGHAVPERMEVVDGSDHIAAVDVDDLTAFYTAVDAVEFSQPVIDSRSKDVEWLGAIGYRHQFCLKSFRGRKFQLFMVHEAAGHSRTGCARFSLRNLHVSQLFDESTSS